VHGQLLGACGNAAQVLEPTDRTFDDVAPSVLLAVEDGPSAGPPSALLDLVTALGDHRPHTVLSAPGPNGLRGVSLISRKALGPLTGPAVAARDADRLHERDELGALVHVARRQAKRRDRPPGVTHHVELGAKPAPAPSQGVVAGLARGPGFFPSPRLRP